MGLVKARVKPGRNHMGTPEGSIVEVEEHDLAHHDHLERIEPAESPVAEDHLTEEDLAEIADEATAPEAQAEVKRVPRRK